MFQSPLRQAALLRKPSALASRLATTSVVVEPAIRASRPRQDAAPAGRGCGSGSGSRLSAPVVSRSVIGCPCGPSTTILSLPSGRHSNGAAVQRADGCHDPQVERGPPAPPGARTLLALPGRSGPRAIQLRTTQTLSTPGSARWHRQVLRFPVPGPRWRLRGRQRRTPAGSIVTDSPIATMPPAAAPPMVPAPPAPPPPPPTGGSVGVPPGHGIGLPGIQMTGGWFWFRHRKGLPLPLLHCWGWCLGLGSGGTRFHALPKLAGRAGHDWTGTLLNCLLKKSCQMMAG